MCIIQCDLSLQETFITSRNLTQCTSPCFALSTYLNSDITYRGLPIINNQQRYFLNTGPEFALFPFPLIKFPQFILLHSPSRHQNFSFQTSNIRAHMTFNSTRRVISSRRKMIALFSDAAGISMLNYLRSKTIANNRVRREMSAKIHSSDFLRGRSDKNVKSARNAYFIHATFEFANGIWVARVTWQVCGGVGRC